MPSPVLLLLIATLLHLVSFILLRSSGQRLGKPLAGWIGTTFAILSFVCTLLAMVRWYEGTEGIETWGMGVRPILRTVNWLPIHIRVPQRHRGFFELGVYVDSLTIAMFAMITLVASIVHVFSVGFIDREEKVSPLFANLALACFSMLGFAISGTLLQMLIFWGLIGLSSRRLIASSSHRLPPQNTMLRRAITQFIGDCGLWVGIGILFCKLTHFSLPSLWITLGDAASGHAISLPDGEAFSLSLLTAIGLCIFCAPAAKSAQFPLQIWLADAAFDAPAPASALFATVTTTAAGVYLVARLFPILTPDARLLIAIIGLTTLTLAAFIAAVQRDLLRLLAWTTVSQLGYMMLAMGVGSWVGGLFHLVTCAFILALLFLAAGSVIAANRSERDISRLGGLWRRLPVTAIAFAIAALAMAGAPFLGKYYSQAVVLTDAAAFADYAVVTGHRAWAYSFFFALPVAIAVLTAFTMTRCWMLTFAGRPRSAAIHEQVRERTALWMPLLILAVPAIISGYAMNVPELLRWSIIETKSFCDDFAVADDSTGGRRFTAFDRAWPVVNSPVPTRRADEPIEPAAPVFSPASLAHEQGRLLQQRWMPWAWIIGIAPAIALYWKGPSLARRLVRHPPLRWIHTWLYNGMFFDELYDWTLVNLVVGFCGVVKIMMRRSRKWIGTHTAP